MSDMDVCFCVFFWSAPMFSQRTLCTGRWLRTTGSSPDASWWRPIVYLVGQRFSSPLACLALYTSLRTLSWILWTGAWPPTPGTSTTQLWWWGVWFSVVCCFKGKIWAFVAASFPKAFAKPARAMYAFISQILSSSQLCRALSAGRKFTVLVHSALR